MELLLSDWIYEIFGKENLLIEKFSYPPIDIFEENDNLIIEMAIAGFSKDEINVEIEKDVLKISGKKKEKPQKNYIYNGIAKRALSVNFPLSGKLDTEKVEAKFENGILSIKFPKKEEFKKKVIELK